jgi:hypothetical protein
MRCNNSVANERLLRNRPKAAASENKVTKILISPNTIDGVRNVEKQLVR